MVVNLIMFLMLIGIIYIFAYPDSQIATTTSAIAQIWSGNCRLSCRQSEYSGFSGLSALTPRNSVDDKGCLVGRASLQGPNNCVCASCPCELVESVFRTCSPAITMYSSLIDTFSTVYYAVINQLSDLYNYVETAMNCRATCQQPQLVSNGESASDTMLYFGNKRKNTDTISLQRRSDPMRQSRSIVFRDVSDTQAIKREETSSKNTTRNYPANNESTATLKPKIEDDDKKSVKSEDSCSKCLQKGTVCMKHCPKSSKNK